MQRGLLLSRTGVSFRVKPGEDTYFFFQAGGWILTWMTEEGRYVLYLSKAIMCSRRLTHKLKTQAGTFLPPSDPRRQQLRRELGLQWYNSEQYSNWPPRAVAPGPVRLPGGEDEP